MTVNSDDAKKNPALPGVSVILCKQAFHQHFSTLAL